MKIAKVFPICLLLLDLAASLVWYYNGDWRRGTYWLAAAVLTVTVTF